MYSVLNEKSVSQEASKVRDKVDISTRKKITLARIGMRVNSFVCLSTYVF